MSLEAATMMLHSEISVFSSVMVVVHEISRQYGH